MRLEMRAQANKEGEISEQTDTVELKFTAHHAAEMHFFRFLFDAASIQAAFEKMKQHYSIIDGSWDNNVGGMVHQVGEAVNEACDMAADRLPSDIDNMIQNPITHKATGKDAIKLVELLNRKESSFGNLSNMIAESIAIMREDPDGGLEFCTREIDQAVMTPTEKQIIKKIIAFAHRVAKLEQRHKNGESAEELAKELEQVTQEISAELQKARNLNLN